jgi:hypothetical protein
MKAILSLPPHPFAERRHSRQRRAAHESTMPTQEAPPIREVTLVVNRPSDPAAQRVRDAGGPIDRASYTCMCGYVFLAPVSTTVQCPHCHAAQAW